MPEYEDQVDNELLHSLDIEFEGLHTLMWMDGAKKAIESTNEKLRHSTREKKPVKTIVCRSSTKITTGSAG